jgi:DNA-binding transcriptional MocR family regulator
MVMMSVSNSPIAWEEMFAGRAGRMQASEIRELLKLLQQPDIVSFAGGIPDPALFPMDAVRAAYADILSDPETGPQSLQYSVSEGYAPLREWIVGYMGRLGVPCTIENVVITSGSQQGLDYIAKLFLSPGDTALVEEPTYLGALQAFNAYEPRYDILFGDDATAAGFARRASADGARVGFAYVVPEFANPTGDTLSEERRRSLLRLVDELGVPLIEDAAYEALRFDGDPIKPCAALALETCGDIEHSRVMYAGTFSKTVCPGLRVGWICAGSDVVRKIVLAKQAGDLHSSTLNQMVVHRVVEQIFDAHVNTLLPVYRKRRDAMLAALEKHMPAGTSWTKPRGGMFVWVTLPPNVDGAELLERSLAEEQIGFVPGAAFSPGGRVKNTIRLNYSLAPEAVITEGIGRLGALITRHLAGK